MPSTDAAADARAARHALERLLSTDAPGLVGTLPGGFTDAIERFVALLLEANARVNITRVVEPDAVARLHLLDAAAALPWLDRLAPSTAVDLGTGGGVPGVVLAVARPDVRWLLVDSVRKKADAVAGIVGALGLANVEVVADRAELLGRSRRASFDVVAARALAPLPVLVEYALPLLRVGGSLLAWKGRLGDDELRSGARAASELGGDPPSVATTGIEALGDHRFVTVRKALPTPERYPRRPGEPARRPLGS